ncbi:hypothetical protein DFH06DRAFT_1477666 [Mycena polygramma]|nr:hypothetical protein DFH06DRAFT_1477666 [Mycena polygramma]
MAGPISYLRPFLSAIFLLVVVSSSSAQTVTGTLFGVAYPTNIVQFANGAYDFPGPVVWIGNHPQIDILGVAPGAGGQTTFSYHDVFTQNVGGSGPGAPVTVTQNGVLVQNNAGLFFSEPPKGGAIIPVVQSCGFNNAGVAVCEFNNDGGPLDFTITGTKTPFFTFIAALPTTAPASKPVSKSASSAHPSSPTGSASRTGQPSKSPSATGSQTNNPAAAHKVPIGAIIGAVIGGIVLVGGGLAALLLCRRRRRRPNFSSEKIELDPEPGNAGPFMQNATSSDGHTLPSSYEPSSVDTSIAGVVPTASAFTTSTPSETPRERRRRLKQMQVTVQQLQRNLSVAQPDGEPESQVASQQRQIDMLLGEVERLRAIVARDEALPAYQA